MVSLLLPTLFGVLAISAGSSTPLPATPFDAALQSPGLIFQVTIDGIADNSLQLQTFSSNSPTAPAGPAQVTLMLIKPYASQDVYSKWRLQALTGSANTYKRNLSISVKTSAGVVVNRYLVTNCWPSTFNIELSTGTPIERLILTGDSFTVQ